MRLAAILSVLACGITAALWLRLAPGLSDAGLTPAFGLVAGALASGPLADRKGYKAALISGLALLSAGLWGLIAGPLSQPWVAFASCTLGAGAGAAMLAANGLVAAAATITRASALNLLNLVLPVGLLCNPILSPVTVNYAAASVAALALLLAIFTPMPVVEARAREARPESGRPPVALLALLLAMYAVCEAGILNWLIRYMRAAKVLDTGDAWVILSYGLPLGLVVGRIGFSRIVANVAPFKVGRTAFFAMAFTTALLLLARSPSACWVAVFCVGVSMSPALPTTLAVASDAFQRMPATGMGIVLAAGFVGLAANAPAISYLAGRSTLPTAMLLLPSLSVAMGLFTLTVRKPGP